jgi:hypothetical protein
MLQSTRFALRFVPYLSPAGHESQYESCGPRQQSMCL